MSYYNTIKKYQHNKYCCKFCTYWTFEKQDVVKHTCEDKEDMKKFDREFKTRNKVEK